MSKGSLNGGVICTVRIVNLTQWLGFIFNHKLTMLAEFTKHPEPQNHHSAFKPNILYKPSLSRFCYLRNSYSCFTNLEKNSSKLYSESLKGGVERKSWTSIPQSFIFRKEKDLYDLKKNHSDCCRVFCNRFLAPLIKTFPGLPNEFCVCYLLSAQHSNSFNVANISVIA